MEDYPWPGNVRELINLIDLIVLMFDDEILGKAHLGAIAGRGIDIPAGKVTIGRHLIRKRISSKNITAALEATGGNKKAAAEYLGISRRTLYRLLDEKNIK